jgi:hypothetical protein
MKAYPVAVVDVGSVTITGNTATGTGSRTLNTGVNVLANDAPLGLTGRTLTNISAVNRIDTLVSGTVTNPATATATISTTGVVSLILTTPSANGTTALRQQSRQGKYTFTYTETYGGITSDPVTVEITVN